MASDDVKRLIGGGTPPGIGDPNIPVLGQDPFVALAQRIGLHDFVLVGRKVVQSPDGATVNYVYVPFRCDVVTQLGLIEYGKMMASNQIARQLGPEEEMDTDSDECDCGRNHNDDPDGKPDSTEDKPNIWLRE